MLEILYKTLINAQSIMIDATFERYGSVSKEKWYDLVHFRLDRQSLFLVIQDRENPSIKISHEFQNINDFKFMNLEDRLKFWVYTTKGTHRFYLPYDKEELKKTDAFIDPLIYQS